MRRYLMRHKGNAWENYDVIFKTAVILTNKQGGKHKLNF